MFHVGGHNSYNLFKKVYGFFFAVHCRRGMGIRVLKAFDFSSE